MAWQLLARDASRAILGVLSGWSFGLTLRLNEVGSWRLSLPRELAPTGWPMAGGGLVFVRDGQVVASGNVDDDTFAWSADPDDASAGAGTYTLQGDTDLGRIAYRITYPSPGNAWEGVQAAYWKHPNDGTTRNAEEVLRATVDFQAGPAATTQRRVDGLVLGDDGGAGTQVATSERFTPLLDALRKIALAGGGLAFEIVDNLGGGLVFNVRAPLDRTGSARFSVDLGNLENLLARRVAPSLTDALIGAQGDLAARERAEIHDPAAASSWGRREAFLDQRQVDKDATTGEKAAEYAKAAAEAFASGGEQTSIAATILQTPAVQWRRDYDLGDRVSVDVPWGAVTELVRQVDVEVTDTGVERVASVIGSSEAVVADPLASTVRKLLARISQLERSL